MSDSGTRQAAPEDQRLLLAALGALGWLGRHRRVVEALAAGTRAPDHAAPPGVSLAALIDAALGVVALERRLRARLDALAAAQPAPPRPPAAPPHDDSLLR